MEGEQPAKKRRLKRRVWRELPRSVLVKVFSYLPLESLLSTRLICREWRELGGTRLFQELWRGAEAQRERSDVIIKYRHTDRHTSRCYSTSLRRWCNVPNRFFMPDKGFLLKDANRGLVAARLPEKIAVGNPVSGKWVEFNPPAYQSWTAASWTLLVARDESFKLMIESFVYHSGTGKWESVSFPGDTTYGPVYQEGEIFFYLCTDQGKVKLIRGSVEDPKTNRAVGEWRDSNAYPANHKLISYKGELGMIRDTPTGPGRISVFYFDEVMEDWVERSQLPRELWSRVVRERRARHREKKELGEGRWEEAYKFASFGSGCVGIVASDCSGLILFDSSDDSWRWVDDTRKADVFLRRTPLFAFELRL